MDRCTWVNEDPLYIQYHDCEWGVPVYEDQKLFEFLILEGAQAGLSWYTILKRRENYKNAFAQFDVPTVAAFSPEKVSELLTGDYGIIRNRLKVESAVQNARSFLDVAEQYGSFSRYIWGFVDGRPIINHWETGADVPAYTALSERISKDMKKRGFKFVGSTILYAYMQATGMVMDHVTSCFRYHELCP